MNKTPGAVSCEGYGKVSHFWPVLLLAITRIYGMKK